MNSEGKGKKMMIVGLFALVLGLMLLTTNLMGGKETQANGSGTPSGTPRANTPRTFSEKASGELLNIFRVSPQSEQPSQTEQVKEVTAELVSQLIKSGANVNTSDEIGRTPLMWATGRGLTFEVIKLLVDSGADVNATTTDDSKRTPLILATLRPQNFEVVKLLVDSGANVNATTTLRGSEFTPLKGAIAHSEPCLDTVKYLVENGADVNVSMNGLNNFGAPISGFTPLIYAVYRSQPCLEVVQYLIGSGADVNAAMVVTGGFGPIVKGTPLILAINAKAPIDIVKVLIDAGADVNATASMTTPLIAAIEHPNLDVMRLLIENGADVNAAAGGMSPLQLVYARRRGSDPQKNALAEEKYRILLDAGADDSSIRQMEDTFRRHFGGGI